MGQKYLVVVESPNKVHKIQAILGKEYRVEPTMGHIEDLLPNGMSVNPDTYEPIYHVLPSKESVVRKIQTCATRPEIKKIFLATDPDREGEAIANSVFKNLSPAAQRKSVRVSFTAITKDAVMQAFRKPRAIDEKLVLAQKARRVIDRLVGYGLSSAVRRFLGAGASAGRIQTPTLAMVADCFEKHALFVPQPYIETNIIWDLFGSLGAASVYLKTTRQHMSGGAAKAFAAGIKSPHRVKSMVKTTRRVSAGAPLNTSSLQVQAFKTFGMSAASTMASAQRLFTNGLLTYPRTDSTFIAEEEAPMFVEHIRSTYGDEYVNPDPGSFLTDVSFAQEAHEAIRPTVLKINKSDLEAGNDDDRKIYRLARSRAIGSFMAPGEIDTYKILLEDDEGQLYEATAEDFGKAPRDGHFKITGWPVLDHSPLPVGIKVGMLLHRCHTNQVPRETNPPPLINDGTIVERMAETGIGRPSTYASTIKSLKDKKMISIEEENEATGGYSPSDNAMKLVTLLRDKFPRIVETDLTSDMEARLDLVAKGAKDYKSTVQETIDAFMKNGIDITPVDYGRGR